MKSTELHHLIRANGWEPIRQTGSHIVYEKDVVRVSVPYHGSKEMGKGITLKFIRIMGLKK